MFLLIFAVACFVVGYWLEMSRSGYLVMSLTSVGFSGGEVLHVLLSANRAGLTVLPFVIGLTLSLFMLLGALVRLAVRRYSLEPVLPSHRER